MQITQQLSIMQRLPDFILILYPCVDKLQVSYPQPALVNLIYVLYRLVRGHNQSPY